MLGKYDRDKLIPASRTQTLEMISVHVDEHIDSPQDRSDSACILKLESDQDPVKIFVRDSELDSWTSPKDEEDDCINPWGGDLNS